MAGQLGQTSRNKKKIQPINWAEAANAPALKGMVSFLEIKPEDIRNGKRSDIAFGHQELRPAHSHSLLPERPFARVEENPISEALPASVSPAEDGAGAEALISVRNSPKNIFRDDANDPPCESLPIYESLRGPLGGVSEALPASVPLSGGIESLFEEQIT